MGILLTHVDSNGDVHVWIRCKSRRRRASLTGGGSSTAVCADNMLAALSAQPSRMLLLLPPYLHLLHDVLEGRDGARLEELVPEAVVDIVRPHGAHDVVDNRT
eukprot:1153229-Pelagomonas_calceolata.AAC.3